MTYLFKAVNIDDSAERENLLNMSVYKTQQAIDIDLNKIPYYYWNLGLARLVQQKIPETEKAWEKALNILSRGRTYLTGSDKLRSLIYQYAIQSLEPVSFFLSEINQSLQKLTEFLEEEKLVYQDHYKKVILKTYFKILLEDLKIITKISNDQNNKMNLIKANINHLIIKLNEMITILDHI